MKPENRHNGIALGYGLQKKVMTVNGKEQEPRQKVLEFGDDRHLFARDGIDNVDDGKAHLEADQLPRHLDPLENQFARKPENDADKEFPAHFQPQGENILRNAGGFLHEGDNKKGDEQGKSCFDPDGCSPIPQDGQHRHDGADPEKDQEKKLGLCQGQEWQFHDRTRYRGRDRYESGMRSIFPQTLYPGPFTLPPYLM